jgi:predicted acylesterase/phospholipase RssA
LADKQAHMIVDSERLAMPWRDPAPRRVRVPGAVVPDVAVLALGGGGWRGAFGGIGSVLYFAEMDRWKGRREVVGISGGAFAGAALSAGPDDADPRPRMTDLFRDLERAGRSLANVALLAATVAVPLVALVGVAMVIAWTNRALGLALVILAVFCASSFLIRSFVTLRWKIILRTLFERDHMRNAGRILGQDHPPRRYRIGATGLHDGQLYSYTTDPVHDRARRVVDHDLATPLGERRLSAAVLRATSLPGVGQFGVNKIHIRRDNRAKHEREDDCCVPDRLVDGGISGIFGRGLVEARIGQPDDELRLVVVDAGRCLHVNTGRTFRDRLSNLGQRVSVAALLARWLMVAFDVAYHGELKRVADEEYSDGYECILVRLAEEEHENPRLTAQCITETRQDALNRLAMLRDRVHQFSLLKASRGWANRSVAVAVAACALDCKDEPDVEKDLELVGKRLVSNGHAGQVGDLADVWKKIPALGRPIQVA